MQRLLILFSLLLLAASCNNRGITGERLPPRPASVQLVVDMIRGGNYSATRVGTHFLSTDSTVTWLDPKPGEKFEQEIVDEMKTLQLRLNPDSIVTVSYKGKEHTGTYSVDDNPGDDQKPGINLRLTYVDEEFRMGEGPAMKVTYTYVVEGINKDQILLLTPRSMNNKSLIVLFSRN